MGLTVQTETIEEPVSAGGDDFEFPAIAYQSQIDKTEVRNRPAWADDREEFAQRLRQIRSNGKNPGIQSDGDVTFLSIQLGSIEPMDPQADIDPGNRKFFVPEHPNSDGLIVRDGNLSVEEGNYDPDNDDIYRLARGGNYIARLANALGQTVERGGETEVRDGFVQDLISGEFDGMDVGFEVGHFGTYTAGDDEVTDQRITQFFPV